MQTEHTMLPATVRRFFDLKPHQDIISWAKENIDFTGDISAERQRIDFDLSPFLIEPLRTWEFTGKIREVTVCGIEQHGKTLLEVVGVLYNMIDKPCANLCIYPSDDIAEKVNRSKYEPLIRKIPQLAAELERPFSRRNDRYTFGTSTMFFQGAGTKVVSVSCKIRVGDEIDQYPVIKNLNNVEDLKKRGRSYSESILYLVCTPTTEQGEIWKHFLAGSRGWWTLRCQGCGKLTMKSCDFGNLQFESAYDEAQGVFIPVTESIRLICPECHHEHAEADKAAMNQQGAYVHEFPDRIDLRPSFQFGALASQMPFMSWDHIAGKILECGKRSDIAMHYELDNSYKGLPYSPRKVSTEDVLFIKEHFFRDRPKSTDIEMVFVVSDTQDAFSPTGIFAVDKHDHLWLLDYANIDRLWVTEEERERLKGAGVQIRTVRDLVETPVRFSDGQSILPTFHLVDYRGHRQGEIKSYAGHFSNVIMYAGGQLHSDNWRQSTKHQRMFYVSAKAYQRTLIWQLYKQKNRESNFLYIYDDLDQQYQQEISAMQPDPTRKSGHLYENWQPLHDAVHDAFDVLKMAYFAIDLAIELMPGRFRLKESAAFRRRWKAKKEKP